MVVFVVVFFFLNDSPRTCHIFVNVLTCSERAAPLLENLRVRRYGLQMKSPIQVISFFSFFSFFIFLHPPTSCFSSILLLREKAIEHPTICHTYFVLPKSPFSTICRLSKNHLGRICSGRGVRWRDALGGGCAGRPSRVVVSVWQRRRNGALT